MRPYTAMYPSQRIKCLLNFNHRLYVTRDSIDTLSEWQLNFDTDLVKISGRQIAAPKISIGDNERYRRIAR